MSRRSKGKVRSKTESPLRSQPMVGSAGKVSGPESERHERRWVIGICLLLALAVWAVFGQTLHHEFINFDDDVYVYNNQAVSQGLSLHGIVWAFTHSYADNWHPLTAISHMMDCQFYGLNPGGHHLTNVLLHAITVILLFLVFREMTGALWPSAFVAAVFAIHPLRVESVAWVAERKDVLSGLFFILTIGAYLRYVQSQSRVEGRGSKAQAVPALGPRLRTLDYGLVLLLYTLGLLCKPMLVTLPFVLLLLDYWPLNRLRTGLPSPPEPGGFANHLGLNNHSLKRLIVEKIPFLLLCIVSCVVTMLVQRTAIVQAVDFPSRFSNALVSYATYIGQMIYPAGLAVLYPYPKNHLSIGVIGWSVLILLIISVLAVAGRRKHPYLLVGWLWYLGMLVPVIGVIQVGNQAHADRYTYLPQIGLYLMVAWGAVDLGAAWRLRGVCLRVAAIVVLAGLSVGACIQTAYWRNSVSLWTRTLACTSGNPVANYNLGFAYNRQGKAVEAEQQYELAIQLDPKFARAHADLGTLLAQQGNLDEAAREYGLALQSRPDYGPDHANLGNILAQQGKLDEAARQYELALRSMPDSIEIRANLGNLLARQGKINEAVQRFQQALDLAMAQDKTALAGQIRARLESLQGAVPLQPAR